MLTEKSRFPIKEILLFGFLPSVLKRWAYRLKGYRIGRSVSIGFGSVICGEDVEIGGDTHIGFLTIIRGRNIRIGPHVQIGALTVLDIPHLEIGEGTKINEQVFVGGLVFPDARLIVGRNCQIMQMTFINPTRSIVIGDDSGIGGDCLLFGHSSWLSKFEGYPVEFDTIEIGKSVSIAWRVFLLPGTRIGDGAVIGANSLVRGVIPPRCLAVGFPARVVSRAPEFPRELTDSDRETILREIVDELILFLDGYGYKCRRDGSVVEVMPKPGESGAQGHPSKPWKFGVEYAPLTEAPAAQPPDLDALVSLRRLSHPLRRHWEGRGTLWVDIEAKERSSLSNPLGEEVVQFLRRYGVRLLRWHPDDTSLST